MKLKVWPRFFSKQQKSNLLRTFMLLKSKSALLASVCWNIKISKCLSPSMLSGGPIKCFNMRHKISMRSETHPAWNLIGSVGRRRGSWWHQQLLISANHICYVAFSTRDTHLVLVQFYFASPPCIETVFLLQCKLVTNKTQLEGNLNEKTQRGASEPQPSTLWNHLQFVASYP